MRSDDRLNKATVKFHIIQLWFISTLITDCLQNLKIRAVSCDISGLIIFPVLV